MFEAIAERVRQEDDHQTDDSALHRVFDWAGERSELLAQIASLLTTLPEQDLPTWVVPKLLNLAGAQEASDVKRQVLSKWAKSTANGRLKSAAMTQLKKMTG